MTISQKAFDEIYELIEPRLNVTGLLYAKEAWTLCDGKTAFSYVTVNNVLRYCMDTMVEQRKAKKLRTGVWEINKPNDPTWMIKMDAQIKSIIK